MSEASLSRREFLTVSGGLGAGLVLSFSLPGLGHAARPNAPGRHELSAWIRIGTDDVVHFSVSKLEMGQGVFTSIPMVLAEELEVDWKQVRAEQAPADARFGRQQTGGSMSIRTGFDALRKVGAAAREMLIEAGSARWQVARAECRAEQGAVVHTPTGRRLRYGELAESAAALSPPPNPPLKERSAFRIVGQRVPRLDTPAKTDGSARYGLDVQVPEMRVAVVERAPTLGARVASFDAAATLAVAGVERVVEIPSGVAVVAKSTWPAMKGRERLEVQWAPGAGAEISDESIDAHCRAVIGDARVARDEGDAEQALTGAATTVEATYNFPYLAHATMEPMNCTAHVRGDACEIWVPTQSQSMTRDAAVSITGLAPEQVTVHPTFMGGGFGRRGAADFVEDAVHISKQLGWPVKVMYSREDDMRAGHYRPTGHNQLSGALDADGRPIAWLHRLAVPSIMREKGWPAKGGIDRIALEGARNLPYAIPNLRVAWADVDLPISTHWWRSVGSSHNAWVTECFFDELCRAGGIDPVEGRLGLLGKHPRHARVLRVAAEKSGWGKPLPEGQARGVAVHESFGSFVAQVAEVSLGKTGRPRVHRVVCAIDCGDVVNPDTIEAQMEGAIAFGLSAALHGRVHFSKGRVLSANFDRYPLLRMKEMPRVETHIVTKGDPLGGVGEPGTPPIAPAVCNALLALTGKPVRSLPITPIV
jgi:isoquinoline 1-oxidoreductase beta subunit